MKDQTSQSRVRSKQSGDLPTGKKPSRSKPESKANRQVHQKRSQRKQFHGKLHAEKILERVSDSFVVLDSEWRYSYVNEKAAQTFGRTPEQLIGKHIWTEFPEGLNQPFYKAYYRAMETQEPTFLEEYYPPYDRWFENRIYPSKDGLSIFFHDITDRKKAELGLREVQEQLSLAVRSANIGLWDWDLLTNKVYYSPEWKSQLGYQDLELSNDFSEWESRVHPEDVEHAKATVSRYIEEPYPNFQNEFRMRHKDGSYRWILAQASLITDEQGKPIRMIGSHIDITERKQAEDLIRRERDFSENALDSLPGVFYMYDEDRKFMRWNKNFETVTGYAGEEIARMSPLDFFLGEDKGLLAARIQEVFNAGESHVEADFVSKDGTGTPYYFTGKTIEVNGRKCLIGVGIDVSERKHAEEQVFYQANLLANVSDAVVATDLQFNVQFWNTGAESLYGWKAEEVIGKPLDEFIQSEFIDDTREKSVRAVMEMGSWKGEVLQNRRNGTRLPILSTVSLIKNLEDKPAGLVAVNRDITERKRAEQVLQAHRDLLETVVNYIPAAVSLLRASDLRVILINPSYQAIAPGKDMVGKTWDELWSETGQNFTAICGRVAETGQPYFAEDELNMIRRTPDGPIEPAYFSWSIHRIGLPDDGGWGLLGTAWETTERKQAEEMLRRERLILRLFVEHAPAAIAMFDRSMHYIVASRRYLSDYELDEQDLVGRSHYEVFPEIPERWREVHRRCLAGAVEKSNEDPFPRQDGRLDWIRWEIRPWFEHDGEIGGVILFSEVITERKRAEQDLLRIQASLEDAQARVHLGSWELDLDAQTGYWSKEMFRLYGLAPASSPMPFAQFLEQVYPEDRQQILDTQARIRQTGESAADEYRITTMQGARRVIEAQYSCVKDNQGKVVRLVGTSLDITDRKRATEELSLSRDRLAELSRRLVEAHENESRNIGRELHDQVGQILTTLKLIMDTAPQIPPDRREKKHAQAQELVNDLITRVSSLSLELRPPMLDDLGLLPALLWHVNRYQEQSGIAVEFKHNGVEGRRFDPQIETTAYRIVQESLTNVARHAHATRVRLEVRARGGWMEMQIEDDGVGFAVQSALAQHRGLSGMRERAQLVGGTFQIESKSGQGARKFVRLPLEGKAV